MAKTKKKARKTLHAAARNARAQLYTIADMVRWCASCFNEAGLAFGHGYGDAVEEGLALVLHTLHLQPGLAPEMFPARLTTPEREQIIERACRRITTREPLAYVIGEAWFAGLAMRVDKRVLVPRSPLAEWVEKGFEPFLDPARVRSVVDVGTGSGCIAIACAQAFPEARIDAVDASADALDVATMNVVAHGLDERVRLLQGDLLADCEGPYDLIVANPPYVPQASFDALPEEFHHEPAMGLVAGESGLDCVHRILDQAAQRLSDDGILVVEVGEVQDALVAAYPQLPFVWLEFERGGGGVFLIDRLRLETGLRSHC